MLKLIDGFDYLPAGGACPNVLAANGWSGFVGSGFRNANTAFGYGFGMGIGSNDNSIIVYRDLRGRITTGRGTYGQRMYVPTSVGPTWYVGTIDSHTTSNAVQWKAEFDFLGCITLFDTNNTIIAKSAVGSFVPGRHFWLEIQWTISSIEFKVNTVPVLTLPAVTITGGTVIGGGSHGWDAFFYRLDGINSGGGGGGNWTWDDVYYLDDTGAQNTTYLGNVRAMGQLVTGNSTPLNFAIGGSAPAATNWQSVLNIALDDTKFVYSATPGDIDAYTIDPIVNAPLAHGVQVSSAFRMDDATQRVARNRIDSAGSASEGVDHYINQSFTFYHDIWELDPATGVGFTGSACNTLKIGPKVEV